MASKKVFTNLSFEGNSELINPKLHPGSAPASKGPGQAYFDTGNGGTLNLQFAAAGATNAWKAVHTSGVAFTTDASVGFTANPPFTVGNSTKITNLNADLLDGKDTSTTAVADKIPIYGANGVLKVSDPLSLDDAANRRYVDSAVQGLDHKESVRVATTANIDVIGTDNDLNAGDTIDGVTLVAGDRVLVKSQTSALQNGIYIAPASGVAASRAADDGQGPNLLGDAGDFNSSVDLLSWSHNSIGTQGLENAYLKLANAGSGSDMRARTDSIALATEIGKTYKFSYYNLNGDSGGFAHLGTTSGGVEIKANVSTGQGTHTFTWQATSEVVYIEFGVTAAEADKYTFFDDVSVTQVDITDGAFVFVEEGTANINSSWVLNETAWTQFGKAGMIDVSNTTPSGTTSAPLTKSGDTIYFGYNDTMFATAANLLIVNNNGIDTDQLANDAVEPSKLLETGDFTMGGLTVNGAIAGTTLTLDGDTGEPTFGLKRDHSSNNNILEAKLAIVQAGSTNFGDLVFRTKTTASSAGYSSHFTDQITIAGETGNVGIGTGTTTPAGKLHIADSATGDNNAVYIQNDYSPNENDQTVSVRFGFSGTSNANKGGIFFKRTANYGRGSLIFATENTGDDTNVDSSDAKLTIDAAGFATFSDDVKVTGGLGVGTVETTEGALTTTGAITVGSTTTTNKLIGITRIAKLDDSPNGTAATGKDDLVIGSTDTAFTGMTIFGAVQTGIAFGDAGSNIQGQLIFDHASDRFTWSLNANTSNAMTLSSSGLNVTDSLTTSGALTTGGIVNHGGFPTVNSSTVQGLQDGACYDFDGTDDWVDLNANIIGGVTVATVSAWVKPDNVSGDKVIIGALPADSDGWYWVVAGSSLKFYDGLDNHVSTATLTAGKWHHVVSAWTGGGGGTTTGTCAFYIDGVLSNTTTVQADRQTLRGDENHVLGRFGENYSGGFFKGQIRDVKIFPSALDAGDVRKLYSGENPKKNLNVELITNGTFDGNINGWTDKSGTGSSVSHEVGNTVLFTGAVAWGIIEQYLTLQTNKTYHLRYEVVVAASGQGRVRVGTSSTGSNVYSDDSAGHAYTGYKDHFFTTSSTATHYISIHDGYNGLKIDNVTLVEVGTLVDFNSRSASSTLWYNQAIPALYNGTLNGVTLSAGSTDYEVGAGEDRKFNVGKFSTSVGPSAGTMGLSHYDLRGGSSDYALAQSSTGDTYINAATGKNIYFRVNNNTIAQLGASGFGDTRIANLGVGTGPDTSYSIVALNATLWKDTMWFGSSADRGRIAWSDTLLPPGTGSTEGFGMLAGDEQILSLGANNTWDHLVISTSGHTTLSGKLILKDKPIIFDQDEHNTISPTADYLTFKSFWGFKFETKHPSLSTELFIASDGTQNHKANRIVNSQTVNDLHRTAEPSLRFSGEDTDFVSLTRTILYEEVTFSAWIKTTSEDTDVVYRGNTPNTIVGDHTGGISHSWGVDDGYVTIEHYDGSTSGNPNYGWATPAIKSTEKVNDGKWHQVCYTLNLDTGAIQIYIDGAASVHSGNGYTLGIVSTTEFVAYDRIGGSYDGGSATNTADTFDGEIKDVRIHNRVLDADEVAAAYNGESTPHRYGNSNNTNLLSGNDTTCDGPSNWVANDATLQEGGSYNSRTAHIITSTAAGSYVAGIDGGYLAATGETTSRHWNITVDVYIPSSNSTWKGVQFDYSISNNGNTWMPTATDTWQTITHTVTENTVGSINQDTLKLYAVADNGAPASGTTSDVIGIDNIKFTRAGEVAAYTPKSIAGGGSTTGGQWFDTTSNENHGTIHEATVVNPIKLGPLEIGTENQAIFRHDDVDSNPIRLINRNGANNDYTVLDFKNKDGNSVGGYLPAGLGVKTTDANNRTGRMEFWVAAGGEGSTDNYNKDSDTRLELANTGSVTATQKDSGGDLAQVTRSHNCEVTFSNGSSATQVVVFHGLKTRFVHVTVREDATFAEVEIANRSGDWTGGSLDSGTESTHVTIDWASADEWASAAKKYYVAISGGHNGNDSIQSIT